LEVKGLRGIEHVSSMIFFISNFNALRRIIKYTQNKHTSIVTRDQLV